MTDTPDDAAVKEGTTATTPAPTRDASDVYDRQIRLWGAEAQAKMSKAKVLYVHVTGATSEVIKNMVLAGIPAALFDSRPYPVKSTSSFFLASAAVKDVSSSNNSEKETTTTAAPGGEEPASKKQKCGTMAQAVQPAIEDLNPLLGACPVLEAATVDELLNDTEILQSFSVVVASRLTPTQATTMAKTVTDAGGKFFLVDTFGMDGACWIDLGAKHIYRPEKGKELLDAEPLKAYVNTADMFDTPLHQAVNRFHKKFPPVVWARYRLLLAYAESAKAWPDIDNSSSSSSHDDFTSIVQAWVKETSPDLLSAGDEPQAVLQPDALSQLHKVSAAELAPVASVLGGLVGNEVIKALSGKGTPANNTLLLEGMTGKAWTFLVQPKK